MAITRFTTGDRVMCVRNQTKYWNFNIADQVGTVKSSYGDFQVPVLFDNARNPRSGKGYFYIPTTDLEFVNDCDNVMEENDMEKITNYYNIVRVQYLDNNTPSKHIYANFDMSIEVGDMCVIKSMHHGLGLAKVVEIIVDNTLEPTREVVAKVFTCDYDERVRVRKQAAELKDKMRERAKQLQDIALFQMLAKDDPDMMELLNQYQSLSKM